MQRMCNCLNEFCGAGPVYDTDRDRDRTRTPSLVFDVLRSLLKTHDKKAVWLCLSFDTRDSPGLGQFLGFDGEQRSLCLVLRIKKTLRIPRISKSEPKHYAVLRFKSFVLSEDGQTCNRILRVRRSVNRASARVICPHCCEPLVRPVQDAWVMYGNGILSVGAATEKVDPTDQCLLSRMVEASVLDGRAELLFRFMWSSPQDGTGDRDREGEGEHRTEHSVPARRIVIYSV